MSDTEVSGGAQASEHLRQPAPSATEDFATAAMRDMQAPKSLGDATASKFTEHDKSTADAREQHGAAIPQSGDWGHSADQATDPLGGGA